MKKQNHSTYVYNCMYRGMDIFWSLVKMILMPPSRSAQISSRLICLPYELPPLLPPPLCILWPGTLLPCWSGQSVMVVVVVLHSLVSLVVVCRIAEA